MGDTQAEGFGFGGRIGRTQFWMELLVGALGVALIRPLAMALTSLNAGSPRYAPTFLSDVTGGLWMLGHLLLTLAACAFVFAIMMGLASTIVRRLHDRGRSGGWLLVYGAAAYQVATDAPLWHGTPTLVSVSAAALLVWGALELGVLPGRAAGKSAIPA